MITFQQDAIDVMEHYRNYTADNINKLQAGFIPAFLDISWCKSESYYHDTKEYISRLPNRVVLKVEGVRNNLFNQYTDYVYLDNMINAHKTQKVQPFMLFINGRFIKWSNITVVRDYDDVWLVVNNIDSDTVLSTVDIIYIPFIVEYVEYKAYNTNNTLIFRFDEDGTEGGNDIFISTPEKHIKVLDYKSNGIGVLNKTIGVDKSVKLSSDNVVTFDNGILNRKFDILTRNLSLLTINNGVAVKGLTYKVFYSLYSNSNIANIVIPDGTDYLINNQKGSVVNKKLDIAKLEEDFNMQFSKNLTYESNTQINIKSMFKYNQGLFDDLYKAKSNVYTLSKTGAEMKALTVNGVVRLNAILSDNECHALIFLNGNLYNAYNTVVYGINSLSFNLDINVINNKDVFEIIYFKNVYDNPIYANISQGEFVSPKFKDYEELKVISEYDEFNKVTTPGVYHYNKFSLNSNNTITFKDSNVYNKNIYILSDRQFKYSTETITVSNATYTLPEYFKTCINPNKYMVFVNSRLVNKINYKISLDEEIYNTPINITFKRALSVNDIVEIVYVPDEITYINSGFKLVLDHCKLIASKDNQTEFRIVYPFDKYLRGKDGFAISYHNTIVSPERYTVINDRINFTDGTKFKKKETINLIFLYNLFKADFAVVSKKTHVKLIHESTTATVANQTVFNLPRPSVTSGFIVSINSVLVDCDRYTISNGQLVFKKDSLNIGEKITFIYAYSEYDDLYIDLKYKNILIFKNNTASVPLPVLRTDNFFISTNSTFVDPDRYTLDDDFVLTFNESCDYLGVGDRLSIIYIDDTVGSDGFKRYNKLFTYTYLADQPNQTEFEMPYLYDDCLFDKSSFIVVSGSTILDPDRYEIDNNNCKLRVLDPNDALQVDEGLSYIYCARILSEDGLFGSPFETAITNFIIKSYTTTKAKENKFTLPLAANKGNFVLVINGVFIDGSRYNLVNVEVILLDPYDFPEANINILFIYGYNTLDKRFIPMQVKSIVSENDAECIFNLPTKYKDNFLATTNSTFLDNSRYAAMGSSFVINDEDDYLNKGDILTYIYLPEDKNSEGELRHNKIKMYRTISSSDDQVEFEIPYMNGVSVYTKESFLLLIESVLVDPSLYYVNNNRLFFNKPIPYNTVITYIYSTSILVDNEIFAESLERDSIKIDANVVIIKNDNQKVFSIPLPDRDKDANFYLTMGSTLLNNSAYTIDRVANTVTLCDDVITIKGRELIFNFIHSDFIVMHKEIVKVHIERDGQKVYVPRLVDSNYTSTVVKELVFIGNTLIEPSRYYKGNKHRYIFDKTVSVKAGADITIMYLYLGDDENNPRILSESGYIYIDRSGAEHNLNKYLYFMFLNGKKVELGNILDICDNLVRIEKFPGTRYNLSMLSFTKMVPEFDTIKYKRSLFAEVMDDLMADDLDLVFNRSNRMIGSLEEVSIDKIVDVVDDEDIDTSSPKTTGSNGVLVDGSKIRTIGIDMTTGTSTDVVYEYKNNTITKISSVPLIDPTLTSLNTNGNRSTLILNNGNYILAVYEYTRDSVTGDQYLNFYIVDSKGLYNGGKTSLPKYDGIGETWWYFATCFRDEKVIYYAAKRCENKDGIWSEYYEIVFDKNGTISINLLAGFGYNHITNIDWGDGITMGYLFDGAYINTFTDTNIQVKPILTRYPYDVNGQTAMYFFSVVYEIYYKGIKEASFGTGVTPDATNFSTMLNTMLQDRFSAYIYAAKLSIYRVSQGNYIITNPMDPILKESSISILNNNTISSSIKCGYDFYLTKNANFTV